MSDLITQHCKACEGGVAALDKAASETLLAQIHGDWKMNDACKEIARIFRFKNYYQTMAFVNAVAYLSHQEDHHPDLEVAYSHCTVRYSTHAIGGLSDNDFICAAKVDALVSS